ncbi:replication protein A3 [Cryptosporidium ubiquitum]|uniref:Replication protein A3 n=1 Tax=Cryptosporidium ubiquitum TaxID=857276 RepID=A0A1J4MJ98_9CRYT|nr:replication protein A3 [Cryptosporidium ubiquitum]OII74305.1 replication protein A3 [Cryptosporidium ubiquitum]
MQSSIENARVNKGELHNFINKQVRFVGKVVSIEGEIAILEAPDGGTVKCKTVSPPPSTYVEVIAQVMPDLSLTQTDFMFDLGDSLNMDLVNESIKISFHPKLRQHWEPVSNIA